MTTTTVCLIGAPHDTNSSFLQGAAQAPDCIRRVLHNGAANMTSESGVDISTPGLLRDAGNIDVENRQQDVMLVESGIAAILAASERPLMLGGDHAVTYPALKAISAQHGAVDILHFDAHSDTYPDFDGNPYSHASPFARILEAGLCERLVQVGIRTLTEAQQTVITRYGVECEPWRGDVSQWLGLSFARPLYISVDIDALDPAFAPAVSHHEPGGMTTRDILQVLHTLKGQVVGADVVEYNPLRDQNDMTAMVCAKFVKELVALLSR
ncbi:MAG: agmatinase [Pseudomonadota bacterium]